MANPLSYFIPVLYAVIQLVILTFIGYFLRSRNRLSTEFFNQLNEFLAQIAIPLYYFSKVSRTNINDILTSLLFPFAVIILVTVSLSISWGYLSAVGYRGKLKQTGMAMGTFGNSGFLPLFLIELFPATIPGFGEHFKTTTALLYQGSCILIGSPVLWGGGNYLCAGYTGRPKFSRLVSPPVFGILAGLLLTVSGLQPYVLDPKLPFFHVLAATDRLGSVVTSLLLLCLGATIANLKDRPREGTQELVKMSVHISVIRFLFIPGLFFGAYFLLFRPLGLNPTQIWVFFLQMVLPPATSLSVLAARAKTNEDHIGFSLLVTYIVYIVILPIYLVLFLSLPGVFV